MIEKKRFFLITLWMWAEFPSCKSSSSLLESLDLVTVNLEPLANRIKVTFTIETWVKLKMKSCFQRDWFKSISSKFYPKFCVQIWMKYILNSWNFYWSVFSQIKFWLPKCLSLFHQKLDNWQGKIVRTLAPLDTLFAKQRHK